jgi:hypothetical protein
MDPAPRTNGSVIGELEAHGEDAWSISNGTFDSDELTSEANRKRGELAEEAELPLMEEAQLPSIEVAYEPTRQRSEQTEEAERNKEPVKEEFTMSSHDERRTANGDV